MAFANRQKGNSEHIGERCFMCRSRLKGRLTAVGTGEDQIVYVGRCCARYVRNAGDKGYPCGDLRLYWFSCICPPACDCESPDSEPTLCSQSCPIHNLYPAVVDGCTSKRHLNGAHFRGRL